MSHHKHSRVGRLPRWQRLFSHLIFTVCAFSGLGFFLKREMGFELNDIAAHSFLVWHGVSAAFALLAFGAVLPGHIRSAWNVKRNRGSGSAMIVVMAALMLSGLLLYYGDEEWRDRVVWAHWIAGFIAFAAFPVHLALGRLANRRTRPLGTKSASTVGTPASALQ